MKSFLANLIALALQFNLIQLQLNPVECGTRRIKTENLVQDGHNAAPGNGSTPCTTPNDQPGSCVAAQQCRNIWSILTSPTPDPLHTPYIKQAECTLPGGTRSFCCESAEIDQPYTKLPHDCGRTMNGQINEHPWIALLRYTIGGDSIQYDLCTGSLINERYVLTAGFCVDPPAVHGMALKEVHLGVRNRKSATEATEVFGVHSIVAHPSFSHSSWYRNNIGLIRLNRKVIFKNHIRPICLPSELQSQQSDQFIVAGWRLIRADPSDVLLGQSLSFAGNEACNKRLAQADLAHRIDDTQLCFDGVDDDSRGKHVYGDRGSPLESYDGGSRSFVQFGVQSGHYANQLIFTRVESYLKWVLENIKE